jgi:SAM-dependent methyltransferase
VSRVQTPAELPVSETLRFLSRALPRAPARILEVGSGDGALSCALAERGYEITALDLALERPDLPGAAGVRWVEGDFLHYGDEAPYDGVLFTRSLHHVESLEGALDRTNRLLRPGGILIAEEFAYDRVNLPTARWFYDLESVLVAAGLLTPPEGGEEDGNPLGRWRREHTHDPPLHTGHDMLGAVRERFEMAPVEEAPYLYRTFCAGLEKTEHGVRTAERIFAIESRMIRERDLAAAGIRIVASAPD